MTTLVDELAAAVSTVVRDPQAMESYRRDQCLRLLTTGWLGY